MGHSLGNHGRITSKEQTWTRNIIFAIFIILVDGFILLFILTRWKWSWIPTIKMWALQKCSKPKPSWCCELWCLAGWVKNMTWFVMIWNVDIIWDGMKWYDITWYVYHTVEMWLQIQRCLQDKKKRQRCPSQIQETTWDQNKIAVWKNADESGLS